MVQLAFNGGGVDTGFESDESDLEFPDIERLVRKFRRRRIVARHSVCRAMNYRHIDSWRARTGFLGRREVFRFISF